MPGPDASAFFFFNDTATTEIYTLSLHDALPILRESGGKPPHSKKQAEERLEPMGEETRAAVRAMEMVERKDRVLIVEDEDNARKGYRSEEHTSELQSRSDLVCRLLLEKKKRQRCLSLGEQLLMTGRPAPERADRVATRASY